MAQDTLHPFKVKTGQIQTVALGTSFNVRFRDSTPKVTLLEGSVKVSSVITDKSLFLSPGQAVNCSENETEWKAESIDLNYEMAWKMGTIIFKDEPLKVVIAQLERWYNVEIETYHGFPVNLNFNGTFNNENLESIISGISYALDCKYNLEKGKVILKNNKL